MPTNPSFKSGDEVLILTGPYKGIFGMVVGNNLDWIVVRIPTKDHSLGPLSHYGEDQLIPTGDKFYSVTDLNNREGEKTPCHSGLI